MIKELKDEGMHFSLSGKATLELGLNRIIIADVLLLSPYFAKLPVSGRLSFTNFQTLNKKEP